jgi:branched-chain amino acid transport system ATP-binding protein
MSDAVLETRGLTRRFGGLTAVDQVSLEVQQGSVHAVIGPNGAGKTTLINLLSGHLMPTAGEVRFEGQDITRLPAHARAPRGVGRSFQRTTIFPTMSAFENCRLAAQACLGHSFRFLRAASSYIEVSEAAERALILAGLKDRARTLAGTLSHGEQRQLEIAMILATEPRLLLLDEPMAGMSAEESARVVDLLRSLAGERTIVLIEHDMDAVFAIADRITVMVNGAELETGTPESIRDSEAVREAYLGEGEEA